MVLTNEGVSVRHKFKCRDSVNGDRQHSSLQNVLFHIIRSLPLFMFSLPAKQIPLNNVNNSVPIQRSVSVKPAA
jgi:hypothetical protein